MMAVIPTSTTIANNASVGTAQLNEPLLQREVAVAVGATIPVVVLAILLIGIFLRRTRALGTASPWECDTSVHQESKLEDGLRKTESEGDFRAKNTEMEGSAPPENAPDAIQCCEQPDGPAELSDACAPAELYSSPQETFRECNASTTLCSALFASGVVAKEFGESEHLDPEPTLREEKLRSLQKLTIPSGQLHVSSRSWRY
jgi:hypothetical protein